MIEIKFYYQRMNGHWYVGYKQFYNVHMALKFLYKCKNSAKMHYAGDIACDDPMDYEYIQRRFK